MLLDGFKEINLSIAGPSLTIGSYGLTFNKAVVEALKNPTYVKLYVNYDKKMIALVPTESPDSAIKFLSDNTGRTNARINNKAFAKQIYDLMGWNNPKISFKCEGEADDSENIMFFDLNQCREI